MATISSSWNTEVETKMNSQCVIVLQITFSNASLKENVLISNSVSLNKFLVDLTDIGVGSSSGLASNTWQAITYINIKPVSK